MPLLVAIGAFASRLIATRLGFWLLSALAFFGMKFAAQTFVTGPVLESISDAFEGLPADVIAWVRYTNVDRYITGILSAYATAASMKGIRLRKAS